MRAAWLGCLIVAITGCAVQPPVGVRPVAAPVQAQWVGQDAPRLVRQLVLAAFDRMDRNHDRFLDATELDPTVVASADTDKDGRVTSLEWAAANPIDPLVAKWQAASMDYFAHLDTDKDGWVSRAEMKGLATVPGLGTPTDLLFDRYSGYNQGLSPKVFTEFVLEVAFDAGRFKPVIAPAAWPAPSPAPSPSAPTTGAPAPATTISAQTLRRR